MQWRERAAGAGQPSERAGVSWETMSPTAMLTYPRPRPLAVVLLAITLVPISVDAAAQVVDDSVSQVGVTRASAVVDAVFVDRLIPQGTVGAGDWASYLMARLGIVPIPPDVRVRVRSDSGLVRISSRVRDLNAQTRAALGPIAGMLPPDTEITGDISVLHPLPEVVQFYLEAVRVNGVALPEGIVATTMLQVGRNYPALGKSGRSLFVQVPADADVRFLSGEVLLIGPPSRDTVRP
jgi:hypothetical protein